MPNKRIIQRRGNPNPLQRTKNIRSYQIDHPHNHQPSFIPPIKLELRGKFQQYFAYLLHSLIFK